MFRRRTDAFGCGASTAANSPAEPLSRDASLVGLEVPPFQPAIRAFQRVVDVVVAGKARARIGFGKRHLIVDMRVFMAQAPATCGARSSGFVVTEPAFHQRILLI
jgi:hypothetical protein